MVVMEPAAVGPIAGRIVSYGLLVLAVWFLWAQWRKWKFERELRRIALQMAALRAMLMQDRATPEGRDWMIKNWTKFWTLLVDDEIRRLREMK